MKTNLRERLTRYQCFLRPKVHFAQEFSFNAYGEKTKDMKSYVERYQKLCLRLSVVNK